MKDGDKVLTYPITTEAGRSLEFYKDGKYVTSFDPIYSFTETDDSFIFVGIHDYEYELLKSSFDEIILRAPDKENLNCGHR